MNSPYTQSSMYALPNVNLVDCQVPYGSGGSIDLCEYRVEVDICVGLSNCILTVFGFVSIHCIGTFTSV